MFEENQPSRYLISQNLQLTGWWLLSFRSQISRRLSKAFTMRSYELSISRVLRHNQYESLSKQTFVLPVILSHSFIYLWIMQLKRITCFTWISPQAPYLLNKGYVMNVVNFFLNSYVNTFSIPLRTEALLQIQFAKELWKKKS